MADNPDWPKDAEDKANARVALEAQEMDRICDRLSRLSAEQPTAVLLAMLDQLVEVACGTNPALKAHMKLKFYRGVLERLEGR